MNYFSSENLGINRLRPTIVRNNFPITFDPHATNELPVPSIRLESFTDTTQNISSNLELAHRLFGINNRESNLANMPPAILLPGECVANIPEMLNRTNTETLEYSWVSDFQRIKENPIIEHKDILEGTEKNTGQEDYNRRKVERDHLFHQHTHPTKTKQFLHFLPSPGDIEGYSLIPEISHGMIISGEYEQPNGDWVSGFSLLIPTKKVYKPSLRDRIRKPTPPKLEKMTYTDLIQYADDMGFAVYLFSTTGKWSENPDREFQYPFLLKRLTTE